jgi:two-component system cell cycle response regulator
MPMLNQMPGHNTQLLDEGHGVDAGRAVPRGPEGLDTDAMTVLIVDDSAVARVALEATLTSLGYQCLVAEDGEAAWELFLACDPDVIVSDWLMPGIGGDELCRRVREHPGASYTYFILLTSLAAQAHVVRGMRAGADDYLKKPFDTDDLNGSLIAAARVVGLHQRLSAQQTELEALNRSLFEESRHDPLTGVGNRIALGEQLVQLTARALRHGRTYCVALYDVDDFKRFNDTQGHVAGDRALRAVAGALKGASRSGDITYRYGGEEFVVVLPEQTLEQARVATERARHRVLALAIPQRAAEPGAVVTVSAGLAQLEESDAGDFEAVLKRADAALYRAKERGRNQIDIGLPSHVGVGLPEVLSG